MAIASFVNWMSRLKRWISDHLFLTFAAIAAYLILFHVPQVKHLWRQLPLGLTQWFGFIMLLAVMGYVYGTTLIAFWRPEWTFKKSVRDSGDTTQDSRRRRAFWRLAGFILEWLNVIARELLPLSRGRQGYAIPLLLMAVGAAGLLLVPAQWSGTWFFAGGFVRLASLWGLFVGLWLLTGSILGAEQVAARYDHAADEASPQHPSRRTVWQTCGQVLAWFGVTLVGGELLWVTAAVELPGASFRLYSVWALLHTAASLPLIAALVDYLERVTRYPVRLFAASALLAILFLARAERIIDQLPQPRAGMVEAGPQQTAVIQTSVAQTAETQTAVTSAGADTLVPLDDKWHQAVENRVAAIKPGPVVLVAASGGGSRAAAFTALVLRMLADEKFDLPDMKGGTQGQDQGSWADHILMISAVSGGSLATARYVQSIGTASWQTDEAIDSLRNTDTDELGRRVQNRLRIWGDDAKKHTGDPAADAEAGWIRNAVDAFESRTKHPSMSGASPYLSRLFDEMCLDFMAPIARGYLVPGVSRGQGLMHFWEDRFQWNNRSQANFAADGYWDPKHQPLMLINTCDIDRGRRVVIGFPQLPPGLLISNHAEDEAGQGGHYDAVAMSDILPSADVLLSRAVRLSSNFPFGFPVSVLSRPGEGDTSRPLHLLDGGVVDNTGLDSIHSLFVSLHQIARSRPTSPAAKLLQELRQRGVVILVIDSGAKPAEVSPGLFQAFSQPYGGLNAATYTNALRTGARYLRDLQEILSDSERSRLLRQVIGSGDPEIAAVSAVLHPPRWDDDPLSVLKYQLTCNHISGEDAHVMTALALGPQDKATVVAQFLVQRERWRENKAGFRKYFETIQQAGGSGTVDEHVRYSLAAELLRRSDAILQDLAKSHASAASGPVDNIAVRSVRTILAAVQELVPPNSIAFEQKGAQLLALRKLVGEVDLPEYSDSLVESVLNEVQPLSSDIEGSVAVRETFGDAPERGQAAQTFYKAVGELEELASSVPQVQTLQIDRDAARKAFQMQRELIRQSARQTTFYGKGN